MEADSALTTWLQTVAMSLALCVVVLGCASEATPPPDYRCTEVDGSHRVLATTTCPAPIADDPELTCGTLELAEDPDQERSCLVALAWVRYAPDERTDQPPVFVLGGGPGQAMVESTAGVVALAKRVAPGRTFVIHDPRGAGASTPRLDCWQVGLYDGDPATASMQCARGYLDGGHDPRRYRTEMLADDVDALAEALGYERIDLFGVSYGSRLAYAHASLHPDRVRALVLDAATPLDAPLLERVVAHYLQAVSRIFADCAASERCSGWHGDLAAAHKANLERLALDSPTVKVDGVQLQLPRGIYVAFTMELAARAAAELPAFVRAVERGDYAPVKHLLENLEGVELATFLHHTIQCSEELPQNDRARAQADLSAFPAFGPTSVYDLLAAQCEAFGLSPEEDAEPAWHGRVQPLEPSLPVLALTGRYDPLSVAGHWTEAAFKLPEGSLFELPAAGHGARNSACGAELVARFLERPANDLELPAGCASLENFFVEHVGMD